MKKHLTALIPLLAAMLLFASCQKDNVAAPTFDGSNARHFCKEKSRRYCIGEKKYVLFSQGNLQFNPSTNTIRFANEQYDTIGSANGFISTTYDGWLDLFGWGTGSNPGNASTDPADYSKFTDWGNRIGEGYRSLTVDEWLYILYYREDADLKRCETKVLGVEGLLLCPDSTTCGLAMKSVISDTAEWTAYDTNGFVFLPLAGYRNGTEVLGYGKGVHVTEGHYWTGSSSPKDTTYANGPVTTTVNDPKQGAQCMRIYYNSYGNFVIDTTTTFYFRHFGRSVRLVQDY